LESSVSRHNRNNNNNNNNKEQLSTLLFAEYHAITAATERNLHKAARKLHQITTEHGSAIAVQKTKSMALNLLAPEFFFLILELPVYKM